MDQLVRLLPVFTNRVHGQHAATLRDQGDNGARACLQRRKHMVHGYVSRCLAIGLALFATLALLVGAGTAYAQYKPKDTNIVRPVATIKAKMAKAKAYDATECYECHEEVKGFHKTNSHKNVGCDACHGGPAPTWTLPTAAPAMKTNTAPCTT
jgi:hypothetical protein